jgi:hypothetical protein
MQAGILALLQRLEHAVEALQGDDQPLSLEEWLEREQAIAECREWCVRIAGHVIKVVYEGPRYDAT